MPARSIQLKLITAVAKVNVAAIMVVTRNLPKDGRWDPSGLLLNLSRRQCVTGGFDQLGIGQAVKPMDSVPARWALGAKSIGPTEV
jgi:hypothetical protein